MQWLPKKVVVWVYSCANTLVKQLNILAVTRKPHSASFEQRILNHIQPLAQRGVGVTWRVIPKSLSGQRQLIREASGFDGVWWHRHMPPIWSRWNLRAVRCPIVFDFDDPLILSSRRGGRPSLTRRVRFAAMLRRCDAAIAASGYLRQLALPYCSNIFIGPMAIDIPTEIPDRTDRKGSIDLLWIGQRSTQIYLEQIRSVLQKLGSKRPSVRLRLVAHERQTFDPLPVDFRQWSPKEQAAAMQECDIGLCPMPDTPWTRGKCPYKVLQYMSHAMPWVGSAVGENLNSAGGCSENDPVRGMCAHDESGWLDAILKLVDDPTLRYRMGLQGRQYVEIHHNRPSVAQHLAQTWRQMTGGGSENSKTGVFSESSGVK